MSNIDEHGYSRLPDTVVDHTFHRVLAEHQAQFEPSMIPEISQDEEDLVRKWRSWGFSWQDVTDNLAIHREKKR